MIKLKVLQVNRNQIQITDGKKQMIVTREQFDSKIKQGEVQVDCLKVKCLDKQRDKNNNITAYLINDKLGKQMVVTPEQLKNAIYKYQVDCINLTLTSDNRLVDKQECNGIEQKTKQISKDAHRDNDKNRDNVFKIDEKHSTEIAAALLMRELKSKKDISHLTSKVIKTVCNNQKCSDNQLSVLISEYENWSHKKVVYRQLNLSSSSDALQEDESLTQLDELKNEIEKINAELNALQEFNNITTALSHTDMLFPNKDILDKLARYMSKALLLGIIKNVDTSTLYIITGDIGKPRYIDNDNVAIKIRTKKYKIIANFLPYKIGIDEGKICVFLNDYVMYDVDMRNAFDELGVKQLKVLTRNSTIADFSMHNIKAIDENTANIIGYTGQINLDDPYNGYTKDVVLEKQSRLVELHKELESKKRILSDLMMSSGKIDGYTVYAIIGYSGDFLRYGITKVIRSRSKRTKLRTLGNIYDTKNLNESIREYFNRNCKVYKVITSKGIVDAETFFNDAENGKINNLDDLGCIRNNCKYSNIRIIDKDAISKNYANNPEIKYELHLDKKITDILYRCDLQNYTVYLCMNGAFVTANESSIDLEQYTKVNVYLQFNDRKIKISEGIKKEIFDNDVVEKYESYRVYYSEKHYGGYRQPSSKYGKSEEVKRVDSLTSLLPYKKIDIQDKIINIRGIEINIKHDKSLCNTVLYKDNKYYLLTEYYYRWGDSEINGSETTRELIPIIFEKA